MKKAYCSGVMLSVNSLEMANRRVTRANSISSWGSSLLMRDRMAKCSTKSSTDDGSRSNAFKASYGKRIKVKMVNFKKLKNFNVENDKKS